MMTATVPVRAQVAQDTDVKLHKFQPKVQPEQAAPTAAVQRPGPAGMSATAAQQHGEAQPASQKSLNTKTAQSQSAEGDDDDPDLPSVAGGKIDKKTYLDMRSEYMVQIRGIYPDNP